MLQNRRRRVPDSPTHERPGPAHSWTARDLALRLGYGRYA